MVDPECRSLLDAPLRRSPDMPDRPNVLLVCVDQWAGSNMGCAGHPTVLTPTLDQLADNGLYFPNAYSEIPSTTGARRVTLLAPKRRFTSWTSWLAGRAAIGTLQSTQCSTPMRAQIKRK